MFPAITAIHAVSSCSR